MPRTREKWMLIVVLGFLCVALLLTAGLRKRSSAPDDGVDVGHAEEMAPSARVSTRKPVDSKPEVEPTPVRRAPSWTRTTPARREQVLEALRAAHRPRADAPERAGDEDNQGTLARDVTNELREYTVERLRTVAPLLSECYKLANVNKGSADLSLVVEGDPDVGGIVTDAQVIGGDVAGNAGLVECITETLMTVEFDPPETGGTLTIKFRHSLSEEDE